MLFRSAQSTTEAEYIAASEAAQEAVWIRKFVAELGVVPNIVSPMKMYCDNSSAIILAKESRVRKGSRHILCKFDYIHEVVERNEIDILKVHTDENLADPFTKPMIVMLVVLDFVMPMIYFICNFSIWIFGILSSLIK